MSTLRPMLAAKADAASLASLRYPLLVQPKYDGIRCLITEEGAMSRTLKHIPNLYIQKLLCSSRDLIGYDGELIAGETYNKTSSAVMSRDGVPDFTYYVFDLWNRTDEYSERLLSIFLAGGLGYHCIKTTPYKIVSTPDEVMESFAWVNEHLDTKCDGIILRSPVAPYKFGRSTLREQYLIKFKQFDDGEAVVLGVDQLMHNDNPAEKDARGYTKRSSHKENQKPGNYLGALRVKDLVSGIEFGIGTGFTEAERYFLWKQRDSLPGRIVSYKYQGGGGYEAPRFPSFRGFRDHGQ